MVPKARRIAGPARKASAKARGLRRTLFDAANAVAALLEQRGQPALADQMPGPNRNQWLFARAQQVLGLQRPIGVAIVQQCLRQFGIGENAAAGQRDQPLGIAGGSRALANGAISPSYCCDSSTALSRSRCSFSGSVSKICQLLARAFEFDRPRAGRMPPAARGRRRFRPCPSARPAPARARRPSFPSGRNRRRPSP